MSKITGLQAGDAIREWVYRQRVQSEQSNTSIYKIVAIFSALVGLKFYTDITICAIFLYGFYRLASLVGIWFRNEYRYTMERRRLFLKILNTLEKRVAEDKPLW